MDRPWLIAGCAALALALVLPGTALAAQVKLAATLVAANEGAGGDPKASGAFKATIDADAGDFCYSLSAGGVKPTMAHVHTGAVGADGPPVIPIDLTDDECRAVDPALLKQIVAAPANYYVNIHTAEFPKGAARGQLELAK